MDIFNNEILAYLTIAFIFFMILIDYIKNPPERAFLLGSDGKPQFLKLE